MLCGDFSDCYIRFCKGGQARGKRCQVLGPVTQSELIRKQKYCCKKACCDKALIPALERQRRLFQQCADPTVVRKPSEFERWIAAFKIARPRLKRERSCVQECEAEVQAVGSTRVPVLKRETLLPPEDMGGKSLLFSLVELYISFDSHT